MPITSEDPAAVTGIFKYEIPDKPYNSEVTVPWMETVGASFENMNSLSSFLAYNENRPGAMTTEEHGNYLNGSFNPLEEIKGSEFDKPENLHSVAKTRSKRELDWTLENIRREDNNRKIFDQSTTTQSVVGGLIAGFLDPILVPTLAIPAVRGSLLSRLGQSGAIGGSTMGVSEASLQATQEKRTLSESMMNVGAGTLFGTLLGTLGSKATPNEVSRILEDMEDQMHSVPLFAGDTAGSARVQDNVPEGFMDEIRAKVDSNEISPREAASLVRDKRLDWLKLKNEKVFKIFSFGSPVLRVATSASTKARAILENLAEDSFIRTKNEFGHTSGPSVETIIKGRVNSSMSSVHEILDDGYTKYVVAYKENPTGKKLSFDEFSSEVGQAQREGDTHGVEQVMNAARRMRVEVDSAVENDLIKEKLIDSYDEVETVDYDEIGTVDYDEITNEEVITQQGFPELAPGEVIVYHGRPTELTSSSRHRDIGIHTTSKPDMAIDVAMEKLGDDDDFVYIYKTVVNPDKMLEVPDSIQVDEIDEDMLEELGIHMEVVEEIADYGESVWGLDAIKIKLAMIADDLGVSIDEIRDLESLDEAIALVKSNGYDGFKYLNDFEDGGRSGYSYVSFNKNADEYFGSGKTSVEDMQNIIEEPDYEALLFGKSTISKKSTKEVITGKTKEVVTKKTKEVVTKKTKEVPTGNKKAKIPVGDKSYFARVYDFDKIVNNRIGFKSAIITSIRGRITDPADLAEFNSVSNMRIMDHALNDTISKITGSPTGMYDVDLVPETGFLKGRTINVPSKDIKEFLISDVRAVKEAYLRNVVPQLELQKRFSGVDLEHELASVDAEYASVIEQLKPGSKEVMKLNKEAERVKRDLMAIRDIILNRYKRPDDPTSAWHRAGHYVRAHNFVTSLGGMTVSSITDAGSIIARVGLKPFAKGIIGLASSPKTFNLSRKQAKRMAVGLDVALNTRAQSLMMMDSSLTSQRRVDSLVDKTVRGFSKVTGMTYWNASMKQFAGVIYMDDLGTMIKSGKVSDWQTTKLAVSGIDKDSWTRIKSQWEKYGSNDSGLKSPNVDDWDDRGAANILSSAVLKEVDSSVISPGAGDLPLVSRGEVGKIIFQFKSFILTAHNKIFLAGIQRMGFDQIVGFMTMFGMGILAYSLKKWANGEEPSDDWATLVREGIDASGYFGYLSEVNSITEKVSRGSVGLQALIGGEPMSKYKARSVIGDLLGPTAGKAADYATALGTGTAALTGGEISESDIKAVRRLIPYQNLIYLRQVFNQIQDSISNEVTE